MTDEEYKILTVGLKLDNVLEFNGECPLDIRKMENVGPHSKEMGSIFHWDDKLFVSCKNHNEYYKKKNWIIAYD